MGTVASRPDHAADIEAVHVRQHQIQDDGVEVVARLQGQAAVTIRGPVDAEARRAEVVAQHFGEAGIVFDDEYAVGHRGILTAMPALPEAPSLPELRQAVIELAPLLRRQHVRGVAEGLRQAPAGAVGERQLLGPKRLDGTSIDAWLGQQGAPALAGRPGHLPHRQQIPHQVFDDGAQLLLLFIGCINFDGEVPDGAVGTLCRTDGVEGGAHEGRPVPIVLADGTRGCSARQRGS